VAAAATVGLAVGITLWVGGSPGTGSVRIESVPPGATVLLDGEALELVTPVTKHAVPAGKHSLLVGKLGHLDYSGTFELADDAELTVPITLQPTVSSVRPAKPEAVEAVDGGSASKVIVTVRSEPAGAQVLIDGVGRGLTPALLELHPHSQLTLKLVLRGHQSLERKVNLTAEPKQDLSFALDRQKTVRAPDTQANSR
jgi:hypothetical protein